MHGKMVLALGVTVCLSAQAPVKNVTVLTGVVSAESVSRFIAEVGSPPTGVIGINVDVIPSDEGSYIARLETDRLVIASQGVEIVLPGRFARRALGEIVVQGMFVPRSGGGTHQGVTSIGLEHVDEGAVRLNPAVVLVEKPL